MCLIREVVEKLLQTGFGDRFLAETLCEQVERKDWGDDKEMF